MFRLFVTKVNKILIFVESKTVIYAIATVQKHQFFGAQPSSQASSHIHT